ncbi:hypothetical protein [Rhodopseudomonas sp.]|uniref:hypothetical protein n=1 Tax=Rhodopseudomonas sp. TaxID=1078 RepID=UPI0025EE58D3|nr:hypothetical protein [Rhodopseudomonas sp.]
MMTAALGLCSTGTFAQSMPDTENGRYTLSPAAEGLLRLDTRSGTLSTCSDKGGGWACYATPDERAAFDAEIGRLQKDNDRLKQDVESLKKDNDGLKAQLAAREPPAIGKIDEPLPKADSLKKPEITSKDGERKLEIPLPSDRDLDRMMAFLENAWKRLLELANRMQKDVSGSGKT